MDNFRFIKGLLTSRKVWLGVAAVLVAAEVIPEDKAETLVTAIVTIAGIVIAAIAVEDAADKIANGKKK